MKIMLDLFDNVWTSQQEIVVQHAADITLPASMQLGNLNSLLILP